MPLLEIVRVNKESQYDLIILLAYAALLTNNAANRAIRNNPAELRVTLSN